MAPLRAMMHDTSYVCARMRVYSARLHCVLFFVILSQTSKKSGSARGKRITKRVTQGENFVADRGVFVTKRAINGGIGPDADARATQNEDKMSQNKSRTKQIVAQDDAKCETKCFAKQTFCPRFIDTTQNAS